MARGRPPKPAALKILAGNPGRRPLNKAEPQPPAIRPDCPDSLDKTARAEWDRITPILADLKLLTLADRAAIAAYCAAYSDWCAALDAIAKEGRIIRDPVFNKNGKKVGDRIKLHPAVALLNKADERIKRYLPEFGLSPAGRTRLTIAKDNDKNTDPLSQLIEQANKARRA